MSGFSYLAIAVMSTLGYPPMGTMLGYTVTPALQVVGSLTLFAALVYMALKVESSDLVALRYFIAAVYGFLAMLSFSGAQQWINYYGATDDLGAFMALWDLVLGASIITLE